MIIVAAVDNSDRAVDVVKQARSLADAYDDTLHVVHVLSQADFVDLESTSVNKTNKVIDMNQIRAVAKDIAANATTNGNHSAKHIGLVGNPAETIVSYADKQDARYTVVAGRKRSPAGKAIFGSIGQSIILNSSSPVVVSINQK